MGVNKTKSVRLGMFVACFLERADLFHTKLWKCLCKRKMTAKVFSTTWLFMYPQSHHEVTELVVSVTTQSELGAYLHVHATEHMKRVVPTTGHGPSRANQV